ncbi:dihydroorotate dehydrogenase [Chitinivibrio alkaliphilus]|uniref:Dihydroorotate dehydrogenase n=1 Tax=Chitinivibrio alkaliphilus ACht1 TaxID=1313304 RepID=U7D738_9BACT|nr:dihydroorotate dehydrogenase [Chitinivibrio alkaliphilus]ERP30897.1 dihydroorotate dehydrogenase [Chitinivibrio alkaliphilus ACht1]
MDLRVRIGNKHLQTPVGVASGTFGYGEEYEPFLDLDSLGAIYTKAISLLPRQGNPTPRIVETPSGMLNAIGLANVGADAFITEKIPYLARLSSCAVIPNISGKTEQEYLDLVEKLDPYDTLWGYEINLSCPNVKKGALAFGTDPAQVESITRKLRDLTEKPLIIKLSPNVTDIACIAQAAEAGGADAVSLINTLVGMVIDTRAKKPFLANKTGGLSGPAVRPIGVAMTYKTARSVDIPVIGMGGITCADDAIQYLLAGASAIQVGTWNFIEPATAGEIATGIQAYMKEHALSTIADFHNCID